VIEQREGAADGAAGQQVAGFILLKRSRAAADQFSGLLLGEAEFLRMRRISSGASSLSARAFRRLSIRSDTFMSAPV
jgi:hypothetical protein